MSLKTVRKPKAAAAKLRAVAQQNVAPANKAPVQVADAPQSAGKLAEILKLVRRKTGASIDEMVRATGWQAHSVRGAISGTLRKRLGLTVERSKTDGVTRYRVTP